MDAGITINQLLEIAGIIVAAFGAYKVILEMVDKINSKHDQVQKWDEYDKQIKAIKSEQGILTECTLAMLEGLKQLGCNGKVTEARDKLAQHLNNQAHQ